MTTLETIGAIVLVFNTLSTVYVLFKRSGSQIAVDDSNAVLNYQKAVTQLQLDIKQVTERAEKREKFFLSESGKWEKAYKDAQAKHDTEVKEMRDRMIVMQRRIEEQDRTFAEREAKLINWAERLSHQVYSLGGVPVPIEIKLNIDD